MKRPLKSILVLGLGKVGTRVGIRLKKTGFKVVGAAISEKENLPFDTKKIGAFDISEITGLIKIHDAILSCLPYMR